MDGIIFYWFSWIFGVIVLFFMTKNQRRTFFSYWIFASLILANQYITFGTFTMSLGYILIFFGAFLNLTSFTRPFYHLFISFIIMIGYSGVLLLEKSAPVWMVGPRYLIIPVLGAYIISLLSKEYYPRLMAAIVGLCSGDFLYNVIVGNYRLTRTLGELSFMDIMLMTTFLLFIEHLYQRMKQRVKFFLLNGN